MRRPAPPLLLALLAACSVTTTGAPCRSDQNCPSDQGCGSDGACSTAALSCPGHTLDGQCIPGTSCASGRLVTCSAGMGVCSTGPVTTDCPTHQECTTSGGSGACACSPSRCSASTSSYCAAGGEVVTCAQDTTNAKGCWYAASSAACGDPGKSCAESGGATACTCPTANACPTPDAVQCGGAGQQILRCLPSVAGSACLTWQPATDCAASGLVCSAGACACPANVGTIFYADADSGSPLSATPRPTGTATPAGCRFATLTDALQAAAPPAFVKAVGWTAGRPGGAMVFTEPGAISIGAGAILTTDDLTLDPDHYVIKTAAALTGPFVSIGPGGALEGFELRNEASTGAGVQTSCAGASDLAPVSLSGVRVVAPGGAPPVRFTSGVYVNGQCGMSATNLTVTGAATGILVDPAATTVESTIKAPHVSASTGAGLALVDGKVTFIGGTVDGNASGALVGTTGTGAPSFTATGTAFSGNAGDAVHVARGTLVSDGCPYSGNGTHVHVEPGIGASVYVTVRNSAGAARMSGAANSALRFLALVWQRVQRS